MNIEIDDEDLDSLPDDSVLAFIEADKILRKKIRLRMDVINEKLSDTPIEDFPDLATMSRFAGGLSYPQDDMMHQHMSLLEALHGALDIGSNLQFDFYVDRDGDIRFSYEERLRALDAFSLAYRLANRRSSASLGALRVSFDVDEREEIHRHISKIRKIIAVAELPLRKGDVLFDRLNALAKEVDRTMTRIDTYAAVALDFTSAVGQAAGNLEPVVKLIERVGAVFGRAKSRQDTPELEAPENKLQITDQTPDDTEGD